MKWVMQMLAMASSVVLDPNEVDNVEYTNTFRESILETYSGILTAMGNDKAGIVMPYIDKIGALLDLVSKDPNRDDSVLKAATALIGDMAVHLGSQLPPQVLLHPSLRSLLNDASKHQNSQIKETALWAVESGKKVTGASTTGA